VLRGRIDEAKRADIPAPSKDSAALSRALLLVRPSNLRYYGKRAASLEGISNNMVLPTADSRVPAAVDSNCHVTCGSGAAMGVSYFREKSYFNFSRSVYIFKQGMSLHRAMYKIHKILRL
jgi:hypothetical protein